MDTCQKWQLSPEKRAYNCITRSNTRADDRAILNHALIGEFRKRFFPQSNHACPCGHNRLETRAHILTHPHDLNYDDARVPFAPQKNPEKIMGILLLCIRASATKLSSDSGQVNWLFLRWIFHQLQRHGAHYPTSRQSALICRVLPRLQAAERFFDHRFTFIKEYKLV